MFCLTEFFIYLLQNVGKNPLQAAGHMISRANDSQRETLPAKGSVEEPPAGADDSKTFSVRLALRETAHTS